MLDFVLISYRHTKQGSVEIYPKFIVKSPSKDLMIKSEDFYAVWVESRGLWSTVEQDVIDMIDAELDRFAKENASRFDPAPVRVLHMWDAENGIIDRWHKYVKTQMRNHFTLLDGKLIFSNTPVSREDYASKRLDYPLEEGSTEAWDKLIGTLYSPEEKHKIEWCIGSVVNGASRTLQKFMVLFGPPGSGKSTLLDILDGGPDKQPALFLGYTEPVDSQALGSSTNAFALESFRSNPLVAIQHEGNLSKIEDNTKLNSLVSHDKMLVNEKYAKAYANAFKCFLILSSNNPVKITDAKSGLLRRLIDVTPSGEKVPIQEYNTLKKRIQFELGAIAWKCKKIFEDNPHYYDNYIPLRMLSATNDFYNFIQDGDTWFSFSEENSTTLAGAWALYSKYVEYAKVPYPMTMRVFKEELKNYFDEYHERITIDGTRIRSYYYGFKKDKFEKDESDGTQGTGDQIGSDVRDAGGVERSEAGSLSERCEEGSETEKEAGPEEINYDWLHLKRQHSILDNHLANYKAQYAPSEDGHMRYWVNVTTKLGDIDSSILHYVLVPEDVIVIDFDIPNANGEKDLQRNLEEAAKWPPTYAELSQSGKAIHLHYIYKGDKSKLSSVYGDHIEIKTLTGNQALRRKLTLCNDIPLSVISSGLPMKIEKKKMIDEARLTSEKSLRDMIKRNLAKEFHDGTKPSIDFINKILEDAYNSGLSYDVSDMRNAVIGFAAGSTHHATYCLKLVTQMKFISDDKIVSEVQKPDAGIRMVPFDIEVSPNLFLLCYKEMEDYSPNSFEGTPEKRWLQYIERFKHDHKPVVKMFNPKPYEVEDFFRRHNAFGFNDLNYDRHICYARMMGYSNSQLYMLSKRIIAGDRDAKFREAKQLGYTDVYDFASAGNKMSLKELEVKMKFYHQELGMNWDEPWPEDTWEKVGRYCENDVLATEAAFWFLQSDWTARQLLADITGMTVNDTTNNLTTRLIFDRVRNPQAEFQYRNLAEPVKHLAEDVMAFLKEAAPQMMSHTHGEEESLLPYFEGYEHVNGKSYYQGEEIGQGGWVYAEHNMWQNVALLDITSMHPHSIIAECLFGPRFTRVFKTIVDGRVDIKHEAWDECNKILNGKLKPYIERVKRGDLSSKDLANALKTAINAVYGQTAATYPNAFKDPRNIDNIVAKRGELFMMDLKKAVQEKGYTVAHIKTDSIKIPNADPEIIKFVMNFGKDYGYNFEHEATYDRMCLVNNAVYIAKYATADKCQDLYNYIPDENKKHGGEWTATGKQFAVPYVFKTLFTHEPIIFDDLCLTFKVNGALYLDNNENCPNVEDEEKSLKKYLKAHDLKWDEYLDIVNHGYPEEDCDEHPELVDVWQTLKDYSERIATGHNYQFVGRVGLFTPVKPGTGGGLLLRESGGKYASATGAQGYRWVESTSIGAERLISNDRPTFTEEDIDRSYFIRLVDDARDAISLYCDFEWFAGE